MLFEPHQGTKKFKTGTELSCGPIPQRQSCSIEIFSGPYQCTEKFQHQIICHTDCLISVVSKACFRPLEGNKPCVSPKETSAAVILKNSPVRRRQWNATKRITAISKLFCCHSCAAILDMSSQVMGGARDGISIFRHTAKSFQACGNLRRVQGW